MSKDTNKLTELFTIVDPDNHSTANEAFCYFEDGKAIDLDRADLPKYEEYDNFDQYMHALLTEIAKKTDTNIEELIELHKNGNFTVLNKKEFQTVRAERARYRRQSLDYSSKADERRKAKIKAQLAKVKDNSKRIIAGVGAVAVVGLSILGITQLVKLNKKSSADNKTVKLPKITTAYAEEKHFASLDDYLKSLPEDSARKEVFTRMLKYAKTSNDTADVILGKILVTNDYNDKELIDIFGKYEDLNKNNSLVDALKESTLKEVETLLSAKETGDFDLLLNEEGRDFYLNYLNNFRTLVQSYNTESFKAERDKMYNRIMENWNVKAIQSETTEPGFEYHSRRMEDYYASVVPMITASEVICADMNMKLLTDEEHKTIDYSNICNLSSERFDDINDTLTAYRMANLNSDNTYASVSAVNGSDIAITLHDDLSFEEVYEMFKTEVEKVRSESNLKTIRDNFMQEMIDRKAAIATKMQKQNRTNIKGQNQWLNGLSSSTKNDIQSQIDAIDGEFAEQNRREEEKWQQRVDQIEKADQKEVDKVKDQVDKENSWMNDKPNSVNPSPDFSRPTINDVDDHIKVDDEYVKNDGSLEFDGPIYDQDGNIIDVPRESALTEEQKEVVVQQMVEEMASEETLEEISKTK